MTVHTRGVATAVAVTVSRVALQSLRVSVWDSVHRRHSLRWASPHVSSPPPDPMGIAVQEMRRGFVARALAQLNPELILEGALGDVSTGFDRALYVCHRHTEQRGTSDSTQTRPSIGARRGSSPGSQMVRLVTRRCL
jgi:hypothetical protein